MTLQSTSTATTDNEKKESQLWSDPSLKEDFSYLEEICREGERNQEMIRNHVLRLAIKMVELFFKSGMPEMVGATQSIQLNFLHNRGIRSYDSLVESVFYSAKWNEERKTLEQSYSISPMLYNNVLGKQKSPTLKADLDSLKVSLKWAQQNPNAIPDDMKRDVISSLDKAKSTLQVETIQSGIALEPPETEEETTKQQSETKKQEQLKTPVYSIEEIHRQRQEIVIEGLDALLKIFTEMRTKIIYEIPIQSDNEAYAWRDGFIDLANNFTALGDDKHRMDFAGWAKTLLNIELYGAERGLKMSGTEITPADIAMIDKDTLPLNHYPNYDKTGLSYISKEHLDSKGVIIANCFIEMMNRFSWLAVAAQAFSYQAKIRGIRAIGVSNKLKVNK